MPVPTVSIPSATESIQFPLPKPFRSKAVCPGKSIRLVAHFYDNRPEKEKTRYFYNEKNQLDSISENNTGRKYIYKNNQLTEIWYYDAPKEPVTEKQILTYNTKNQFVTMTYFLRDEKNKMKFKAQDTYRFEYNSKGNLIKKGHCYSAHCYTYIYEWKNGNMVLQKDYNNDVLEHEWRMQYDTKINPPALEPNDLYEPHSYNNAINCKAKDYTGGLCLAEQLPRYLYKYNKDGLPIERTKMASVKEFFEYECF
jgi:hypothetical protein